jgi:hypothetical protein
MVVAGPHRTLHLQTQNKERVFGTCSCCSRLCAEAGCLPVPCTGVVCSARIFLHHYQEYMDVQVRDTRTFCTVSCLDCLHSV